MIPLDDDPVADMVTCLDEDASLGANLVIICFFLPLLAFGFGLKLINHGLSWSKEAVRKHLR